MTTIQSAQTELIDGMAFRSTANGHTIVMDAKPESGGEGRGPLPVEVVLQALAGCTGMDVISILRKMKQDVTGYEIYADGDRATTHPMIFTTIRLVHTVRGRNLQVSSVHRAIELSETKYCSVGGMLRPTVALDVSYKVVDEETGTVTEGTIATEPTPA